MSPQALPSDTPAHPLSIDDFSSETSKVKVVDFGPFLDGSNKKDVGEAIWQSFKSTGFEYLTNHGVPQDKIDTMFEWSKELFSQPMEIKQLAPHPASGAHHRGYSAPGREKVKHFKVETDALAEEVPRQVQRDVKESFEVGREDNDEFPNIWFPDGILPGFKEACIDFFQTCYEKEKEILRAVALGFNLPEEYLLSFHSHVDNQLRLLHYPSIPPKDLEDVNSSRIPSHSDFCTMTLLMQDHVGGLEVEDPNHPGTFIPVSPIPGTIVINAGDFLMRWSNDTIRSAIHRVRKPLMTDINDMIPARYSIPYFCGANLSTVVDCLPGTWSAERPKLYSPISAKEYILKRLALNY